MEEDSQMTLRVPIHCDKTTTVGTTAWGEEVWDTRQPLPDEVPDVDKGTDVSQVPWDEVEIELGCLKSPETRREYLVLAIPEKGCMVVRREWVVARTASI